MQTDGLSMVVIIALVVGLSAGFTAWFGGQVRQLWLHWTAIEAIKQMAMTERGIEKVESKSETLARGLKILADEIESLETFLDVEREQHL